MKNTKKLLVGVLSVSALIGTGVAAWSIGGGVAKSTQELSTVTEEIIGNRDITLNVTKDPTDGIRFDSDADLKVTYKVKAERTEDNKDVNFDPYDLSNYENIAKDYKPNLKISTKVFDVVNGEKVELKEDAEFFKYVELPKVEPIDYTVWLGEEAKANDGYEVELEFTWGSEINHENPQIYADKNNVGKTEEEQTAFFQNIISILDDVSFEFTFEVNGREGEVNPPEKETTGEITLPEVANSSFTIEGFDEATGTVEAGEHLITIETEAGKILKDNKLTITEGSIEKTITLEDTTALSRAGGHIYTATYNFLAERVYTFAYEVIDEPTHVVAHKVTFSVTPEEGGSVEVIVDEKAITSGDEVEEGKTAIVTIKNNEGYHLSSVTVNKEEQEISNSTLNIKVDGAKDIVVTFEKDETPEPEPVVFEQGKLSLWQNNTGKALYFNGKMDSYNRYLDTTENFNEAVDLTVFKTNENKYLIQIDGTNTYIGAINVDNKYDNYIISEEAYPWDYDETYDVYTTDVGNGKVFMATYQTNSDIRLTEYDTWINVEATSKVHIDSNEVKAPLASEISVSATSNSIKVGETTELSISTFPVGSTTGEVTYEIVGENNGVVELLDNVITGVGEGSVQVAAKAGELESNPITITVISEDTPIPETVTYEYKFKMNGENVDNNSYNNATELTESTALANLESGNTEFDIFESVVSISKVYSLNDYNGMKFGSSSVKGTISFKTSYSISKLQVSYISWSNDNATLTVNDESGEIVEENGNVKTYIFNLAEPTKEITISASKASKCRFFLTGLEFFLA